MLRFIARLRVALVILSGTLLFCSGAFAMADRRVIDNGDNRRDSNRDNRGDNRRDSNRDNRGYIRGDRHYYRDGRWYKHDSRGNEIAVAALSIGALIEALPPQHTTVVIQGASYYQDDRYYYRQASNGGYVVVSPPVIVQPRSRRNFDNRGERGGNSHK